MDPRTKLDKVNPKRLPPWVFLVGTFLLLKGAMTFAKEDKPWPPEIREVHYLSKSDQTEQPALYYDSGSEKAKPLLVALHTWSGDYRQTLSVPYAEWCIEKDWVFIHPHFRGPNRTPEACGSDWVVGDILSAVDYAKEHANIDPDRIYLVGGSGGGYASILMAGRAPEVWTAVSAWVPISDLERWHRECIDRGERYAKDIQGVVGGDPRTDPKAREQCRKRSALTYLAHAKGVVPLDINAGIHDGHTGSVPIGQSLRAFNQVAEPEEAISEDWIEKVEQTEQVPPADRFQGEDPLYGEKRVLFRRESGKARVTLFEGGHEIIFPAALNWLERQGR